MRLPIAASVVLLAVYACVSCAKQAPQNFAEGPPRLECRAKPQLMEVDQAVEFTCLVAGELAPLGDEPLGLVMILEHAEEDAFAVTVQQFSNEYRLIQWRQSFKREYWELITGHGKLDQFNSFGTEVVGPNDPTRPPEPIEGLEQSLDGSFNITLQLRKYMGQNPMTKQLLFGEIVAQDRLRAKLSCRACGV